MLKKTTSMSENKPVEETASEVEDKPVEETATVKTVKKSESGNILDIFNPHAKKDESKKSTTTAEAEDKSKPELPNILDIFKPKTDDGSSDDKTSPTKPADPNPLGGLFPQKNTDDKKTDVKPLFPSDDPFNIKKTFNDAQQALKEKGVGGLIQSVQQNVQNTANTVLTLVIPNLWLWYSSVTAQLGLDTHPHVIAQKQLLMNLYETMTKQPFPKLSPTPMPQFIPLSSFSQMINAILKNEFSFEKFVKKIDSNDSMLKSHKAPIQELSSSDFLVKEITKRSESLLEISVSPQLLEETKVEGSSESITSAHLDLLKILAELEKLSELVGVEPPSELAELKNSIN